MKKNSKNPLSNHENNNNKHANVHQDHQETVKEDKDIHKHKRAKADQDDNKNSKNNFTQDGQSELISHEKKTPNSEKKSEKYKNIINNLKIENDQLQKQIVNLQSQNLAAKIENQKNIHDFQLKAKEFQNKAQAEIDKIKEQVNEKMHEEKQTIAKYTLQKFLENILQPFTYLMTAINIGQNADDNNVKAYVAGFTMYIRQLLDEFSHFGVSEIKPQIGEPFNEQIHKILKTVEGKEKNTIVEVHQNGFKLHDRVLIPALVIVGK